MNEASPLHHYFILRGALVQHQQLPWHLGEEEQVALAHAAGREEQLVKRALASPLAVELQIAPDEVSEAVNSFLQGMASHGETGQILTKASLDQASLADSIEAELRAAAVMEQLTSEVTPTEHEAYSWFKAHPEKFQVPERREVFQILITINDAYAENRREAVRLRMEELARQAHTTPETFAALAQKHSECPSAVEGGRLGVVPPGHLFAELDRELFTLKSGAISRVVESPLGFHLLRCGLIEPSRQLGWEEVKDSLTQQLTAHLRKRFLQQWLTENPG